MVTNPRLEQDCRTRVWRLTALRQGRRSVGHKAAGCGATEHRQPGAGQPRASQRRGGGGGGGGAGRGQHGAVSAG